MSEVRVNKLSPRSGTTVTLGDSGDTITIPSGVTLANSGTFTNFQSTGIDDNATSTAITINSSQQVGIGTASPTSKLQVEGSTTINSAGSPPLTIHHTDGNTVALAFQNNASDNHSLMFTDGDFRINYDGSEKMRIDSSGNVGIGTTSPGTKLEVNGDITATNFVGSGGLKSTQVFTTSGTYTKPSGITQIRVFVTGGGGGGGGNDVNSPTNRAASGGAGGGTAIKLIDATSITTETVTIGSGGAGGDGSAGGTSADGSAGGTSSFGSHCSATGGAGGKRPGASVGGSGSGISGGIGSTGDLNLRGDSGGGWNQEDTNNKLGGRGGGSYWGGGGTGTLGSNGGGGTLGGGGGGMGTYSAVNIRDGGAGGSGVVYVEEYA